jgi:hypothetical protein
MRREREKFRLAIAKKVAVAGKGVQTIRIQNRRQRRLPNDAANEFLSFRVCAKTRTNTKNGFAPEDFFEALAIEAVEGNGAFSSRLQTLSHVLRTAGGNCQRNNRGRYYRHQTRTSPQRA